MPQLPGYSLEKSASYTLESCRSKWSYKDPQGQDSTPSYSSDRAQADATCKLSRECCDTDLGMQWIQTEMASLTRMDRFQVSISLSNTSPMYKPSPRNLPRLHIAQICISPVWSCALLRTFPPIITSMPLLIICAFLCRQVAAQVAFRVPAKGFFAPRLNF